MDVNVPMRLLRRMSPDVAQGCLDQAAPYGSAYWGAPAAHTRAVEVVGTAESDPKQSLQGRPKREVTGSLRFIQLAAFQSSGFTPSTPTCE